jgi:hypothetical protein
MSAIITTENTIVNEVMNAVENEVAVTTKKSFPSKHLKYLSYALYIMKQVYPDHDTCVEKFVEHLHLSESIENVMNEIDNAITPELENEVREIKRNLNKKPKRKRAPAKKTITEQIVSLANEPIIQRGPPVEQKEEKEEPAVEPVVVPVKKSAKKTRAKKTDWDYSPERPSPAFLPPLPQPVYSDSEDEAEVVVAQAELPKELPKEVVKEQAEVAPKKTKVTKSKVKKDEVVAEVKKDEVVAEVTVATEKKVAKAKVPRVTKAKAKAQATIEEPAPFTEELVEEPEQ